MNNIKKTLCLLVHLKLKSEIFCDQCGKTFAHKFRYEQHRVTHNEFNLKCLHCDKVFNRRGQLLKHLMFHITPRINPYKCTTCGFANYRKTNVVGHVEKVHHKKKWTQGDIHVDKELETRMLDIVKEEADIIQGYVDGNRQKVVNPPPSMKK